MGHERRAGLGVGGTLRFNRSIDLGYKMKASWGLIAGFHYWGGDFLGQFIDQEEKWGDYIFSLQFWMDLALGSRV